MKMIIAAQYNEIGNIKEMFSQLAPMKGKLPIVRSAHSLVSDKKYILNDKNKTADKNPNYPNNIYNDLKELYKDIDILIIPIDSKLISMLMKSDKFKNIFVYEKDSDNYDIQPTYEGFDYMWEDMN